MLTNALPELAALVIGYLLGSIPFGLILTRLAGFGDIRKIGSGNIGATNVLRTGNRWIAGATLLLDGLKGAAAVFAGWAIAPELGLFAGAGAFIGHLFPVWLGFKGGKGGATYIGILAGLWWPGAIFFCVAWLVTALATRISSASTLIASLLTPFVVAWFIGWPVGVLFGGLTILLWWRHEANIRRIVAGTEPRIGARR